MAKIGVLGGTFNPIHYGHLLLAEYARGACGLDEVWFIPTGHSYMKSGAEILSGRERLHMTALALEDCPYFRCLDIEMQREGNTYTYETVELLRERYPEHCFSFLFGADCLFEIESWRFPERIFAGCEIIAAVRDDADIGEMLAKKKELEERFGGRIEILSFLRTELSSSLIRKRVAGAQSIRYLTPEPVVQYIIQKGFYRNENT